MKTTKVLKNFAWAAMLPLATVIASCASGSRMLGGDDKYRPFAPDGIPFVVADSAWDVDMRGNHRAVVRVTHTDGKAVKAILPWRRPDLRPETKKIIVTYARTGREIRNVYVPAFTAEEGTVVFEPESGPGIYHIYYLPYKYRHGSGDARYGKPWNDYIAPSYAPDEAWAAQLKDDLPKARLLRFESRTEFDAFTPMGLPATSEETASMLHKAKSGFMLFPEDRAFPISMRDKLPVRWVKTGPAKVLRGHAMRNEYYVWQIGVWAAHDSLHDVRLVFSSLHNGRHVIPAVAQTCFNQEGVNWNGDSVTFNVEVPKGKVQALWCGIQIPASAPSGTYKGTVAFTASGKTLDTVPVEITVDERFLPDKGDGDLWRMSRLRWLNSRIGSDNVPVAPYRQPEIKDATTIEATGKTVRLTPGGLPASIVVNGREVLSTPFRFIVVTDAGEIAFNASGAVPRMEDSGTVSWTSKYAEAGLSFSCHASLEYDGYIGYSISVSAEHDVPVRDIRLESCYTPYASAYFMGAGFAGGKRPDRFSWNWQGPWDSYWTGGVEAGLHVEYLGGSYSGPLLNDYKPLPPDSWANCGKGTVELGSRADGGVSIVAATGEDTITTRPKTFEFALLATPVKQLDTHKHFTERYYHASPEGFDAAADDGANILNIHHSQPLNPVINYPFVVREPLASYVEHEHSFGRKVKLYYTIRELTNHAVEIHALKSLGHEIFVTGPGYGLPWQCEHLIDDYKPAWYVELPGGDSDAALVLNGFSRWINYYLEGLRWMFENYKIDGIYMDDVSFDRTVMKRIRRIMEQYRPGALIDLHSNTNYSIGPANQYTGFFPYIDRLWFGEWFKYNAMTPDEWLVTFSGIPFGLMSDMLQDGGNRYLGMLFGSTTRHSYGPISPVPVWKLWKSFGIADAHMCGFWDEACPVSASSPDVKATVYLKPGKALIAVGNFAAAPADVTLRFNWDALGIDPSRAVLYAPEVKDFQPEANYDIDEAIHVEPKEGKLLILSETE